MIPILADAINFPLVLGLGVLALAPLLLFEVVAESWVLGRVWKVRARDLWRVVLRFNCWSLLAGIPVKIINSLLYAEFLPKDLPSYFAAYGVAIALGSLLYFAVTVLVEGLTGLRWLSALQFKVSSRSVWRGVVLANLATYAVLAPLHFVVTRPIHDVREFVRDTGWSSHGESTVIFVDSATGHLKVIQVDGSNERVIVPEVVRDYIVSPDLNACLYRGEDGNLYFFVKGERAPFKVWETRERFEMDQVAFSPANRFVAFASEEGRFVEAVDLRTTERMRVPLKVGANEHLWPSVCWSKEEAVFYFKESNSSPVIGFKIEEEGTLSAQRVEDANHLSLLPAFGRVSADGTWNFRGEWGTSFSMDECGDWRAWCEAGLGSGLRIYPAEAGPGERVFELAVNPGLLHLGSFSFRDVAFLDGCGECLFDGKGYIYLLDIEQRRVGTLAVGERFSLLTTRYEKTL